MSNSQHVTILKQGALTWNAWRRQNPGLEPQLRKLNLPVVHRQFGSAQGGPIDLSQADLCGAVLEHATLIDADLTGAFLVQANLAHARLTGANLSCANLSKARLNLADLRDACLDEATLSGADLRRARNLTQAQIDKAYGDEGSLLPAGLVPPTAWSKRKTARSTELARRLTLRPAARNLDPYTLLGISRRASLPEIRAAYLKLVKELHPDGRELDPIASERLKAVNKAYQDLKARDRPQPARQAQHAQARFFARPGPLFVTAFLGSSLTLLAVLGGLYWAGFFNDEDAHHALAEAGQRPALRGADAATAPAPSQAPQPSLKPDRAALTKARDADDDALWVAAEREATSASLHRYLGRYSNGRHAQTAAAELPAVVETEIALAKSFDGRDGASLEAQRVTLRRYLETYPNGRLAPEVERKLDTIAAAETANRVDQEAWADAEQNGTSEGLRRYLAAHPDGDHAAFARVALAALDASQARAKADHSAWVRANRDGSKAGLARYLTAFPDGDHAADARASLALIEAIEQYVAADRTAWARAEAEGGKAALNRYLAAYPEGLYASEAHQTLAAIAAGEAGPQTDRLAIIEPQQVSSDVGVHADRDATRASDKKPPLLETVPEAVASDPLREQADWLKAQRQHSKASYAAYLLTHPNGPHAKEARANLADLQNSLPKAKPAKVVKQVTEVFRSGASGAPASQKWPSTDEPFIGPDGRIRQ